jgi:serine protease Do
VLATGPAGRAGVRAGDRLVKFQGRTVTDSADVERFARKLTRGARVKLTVLRGKETLDIRFRTGEGL